MPPKKAASTATATKKAAANPSHAPYKDMIKDAIINLKERNGSSRQALKKYVRANNQISAERAGDFDRYFNDAITQGVKKGDFVQPKGPSGPVKLAKKDAKPAAEKKATTTKKEAKPKAEKTEKAEKPEKETKAKATTTKKAAPKVAPKKASTKATTASATKKASTTKKAEPKTKANSAKPRTKKATTTKSEAAAPAVVDEKKILNKTKSGRVSKTKATATTISKKGATTKKAATPKKKATPKKAEASS